MKSDPETRLPTPERPHSGVCEDQIVAASEAVAEIVGPFFARAIAVRVLNAALVEGDPDEPCGWTTTDTPPGFTTIVQRLAECGHLTNENLIRPTAERTIKDGLWCRSKCIAEGRLIHCVDAPPKLRDAGIITVNAYPIDVVDELIEAVYNKP